MLALTKHMGKHLTLSSKCYVAGAVLALSTQLFAKCSVRSCSDLVRHFFSEILFDSLKVK